MQLALYIIPIAQLVQNPKEERDTRMRQNGNNNNDMDVDDNEN